MLASCLLYLYKYIILLDTEVSNMHRNKRSE